MGELFNDSQMAELQAVEVNLRTAHFRQYVRGIDRHEIDLMARILREATGQTRAVSYSCGQCIYDLTCDVARIYYRTVEAREKAAAEAAEAAAKKKTTKKR